jgi:hypothetical protein
MTEFQRVMALVRRETAYAAVERAKASGCTQAIKEANLEAQRATHEAMRAENG